LQLGGFSFYLPGLAPRRVLAVSRGGKQKRAPGMESPCRAPVWRTWGDAVIELVLRCLLSWVQMWIGHRYTHRCVGL